MEYVWQFTNKRKLTKKEFIKYLERKIFKTIRQHSLLPKDRNIKMKKSEDIRFKVLYKILSQKFKITLSKEENTSIKNLSEIAEIALQNIINGKVKIPSPKEKNISFPLYYVSDKEIDLYAKLCSLKGKTRKPNKKVRSLMERFMEKNPDLELNIIKSLKTPKK